MKSSRLSDITCRIGPNEYSSQEKMQAVYDELFMVGTGSGIVDSLMLGSE